MSTVVIGAQALLVVILILVIVAGVPAATTYDMQTRAALETEVIWRRATAVAAPTPTRITCYYGTELRSC